MDPGVANANAATQPATETMVEEINSDIEPTQRVLSQERQQTPTEGSKEVRVYADSIWNAVNIARMFPNLSTHKEKTSTILSATKKLETVNDPGTSYAILHVGSNDLDNTRRDDSSVQDCLQKTEELVSRAKTSFPNATIILSQVLPRGQNPDSTLNENIKNYNQSVLRKYKDDEKMLYIRHKKLSTSRHLYKRDGIHLDDITGTSLLVADVKRTIRSKENSHRPDNIRENRGQHSRSTGESTPLPSHSRPERDNSTTHPRPEQDVNRRQHFRDRDRNPRRPWRADADFPASERSRRPNYHRPQINTPHEDIINLAYRLKELLNNF
uniref:Sfy1 n=1 Tax=Branchiostoma belcheri tsingtauense TaxID=155462 RepID=Q9BID7_BRABE|nr:Sfy1 [Branchiostoma belcheri tsingtauense]